MSNEVKIKKKWIDLPCHDLLDQINAYFYLINKTYELGILSVNISPTIFDTLLATPSFTTINHEFFTNPLPKSWGCLIASINCIFTCISPCRDNTNMFILSEILCPLLLTQKISFNNISSSAIIHSSIVTEPKNDRLGIWNFYKIFNKTPCFLLFYSNKISFFSRKKRPKQKLKIITHTVSLKRKRRYKQGPI